MSSCPDCWDDIGVGWLRCPGTDGFRDPVDDHIDAWLALDSCGLFDRDGNSLAKISICTHELYMSPQRKREARARDRLGPRMEIPFEDCRVWESCCPICSSIMTNAHSLVGQPRFGSVAWIHGDHALPGLCRGVLEDIETGKETEHGCARGERTYDGSRGVAGCEPLRLWAKLTLPPI
jgi:hypothetical protein